LNEAYLDRAAFQNQHKDGVHFKRFFVLVSDYAKWPDEPIIAGGTIAEGIP